MKKTKPLLEEHLPSQFIYDLGLYLQTCAHIETSVCSLIANLEAQRHARALDNQRFHELRKLAAKELVSQLSETLKDVSDDMANEFLPLVEWIKTYQVNRHIAAHGAFFVSEKTQSLRVLYTHKRRDHGKFEYHSEEVDLDRNTVLQFLYDADRILRTIVAFDNAVQNGAINFKYPSSAPK